MPSRKRRAGQARRRTRTTTTTVSPPECTHGCPEPPADPQLQCVLVCWAMVQHEIAAPGPSCAFKILEGWMVQYPNHRLVQQRTAHTTLRALLVAKGAALLLEQQRQGRSTTDGPGCLADLIVLLDDWVAERGLFCQPQRSLKTMHTIRDLHDGDLRGRALTRFYAKRVPCQCLAEKDAELKVELKKGHCFQCQAVKERHHLLLCNGCQYVQYCSAACQKAAWKEHKKICHNYANIENVVTKRPFCSPVESAV